MVMEVVWIIVFTALFIFDLNEVGAAARQCKPKLAMYNAFLAAVAAIVVLMNAMILGGVYAW